MLYLSAKHSRSLVWWEDSIRKMFWETFESWVLPYLCERPVKNPSIWKESLTWIVPWIRSVRCGGGTQCKRNYFSPIKWKNPIPSRRWTNKIRWRRSGTENIHLDTGSSNSRRRSKRFSVGIRRVSTSTTSRLISGCRWSNISLLVHVRKLHMPPSTLNPESNFTRREKNHFLFHWHIYIFIFIDASRTTHTNLDVKQERRIDIYFNIDGSRDLSDSWTGFTQFTPLHEKPPDVYMWSGRRMTRRQATSGPDHLWPELWINLGRNAKLKKKQSGHMKSSILTTHEKYEGSISLIRKTRNLRRPSRMLVRIWKHQLLPLCPAKFSRAIRIVGVVHPTKFKTKLACILEASESHKTVYGRISTESSWGPYCRKRRQFTAALQFGTQVYSYAPSYEDSRSKDSGGQRMGEIGKDSGVETWRKSEVRKSWWWLVVFLVRLCLLHREPPNVRQEPVPHWRLYKVDSDSRMPSQPPLQPRTCDQGCHSVNVVRESDHFLAQGLVLDRGKVQRHERRHSMDLFSPDHSHVEFPAFVGRDHMAHRSLVGVALVVARRPDLASPRVRARFAVIEGEWLFRRRGQSNVTCWDTSYRHTPHQAWQSLTARFPQFLIFSRLGCSWCNFAAAKGHVLITRTPTWVGGDVRGVSPRWTRELLVSCVGRLSRPERRHASYIYDAPRPGKGRTPQRLQHEAFRIRGTLGRMPACGKRHQEVAVELVERLEGGAVCQNVVRHSFKELAREPWRRRNLGYNDADGKHETLHPELSGSSARLRSFLFCHMWEGTDKSPISKTALWLNRTAASQSQLPLVLWTDLGRIRLSISELSW